MHRISKYFKFFKPVNKPTEHDQMLRMGNCSEKAFYKKIPKKKEKPREGRTKQLWMSKFPISANELICSEPIRLFLCEEGVELSPKYRASLSDDGSRKIMTKLLPVFTPFGSLDRASVLLESEEALLLEHGVKNPFVKSYYKYVFHYLKITASLTNFHYMIATCLLFGKEDLHGGDWGVVEVNGKKYAATVDHGNGLKKGVSLYNFLVHGAHRKERFLNHEFVAACFKVAEDFERKKDDISLAILLCIDELARNQIRGFVPSITKAMDILEYNKENLIQIAHQIQAEIAIMQGDPAALRAALCKLDPAYFPIAQDARTPMHLMSTQIHADGLLIENCYSHFRFVIKARKWVDIEAVARAACFIDGTYQINEAALAKEGLLPKSPEERAVEESLLSVYDEIAALKQDKVPLSTPCHR